MGERAALIGLDEINSEQLYQQALQAANAELGRLNQSITISNRKLKSKARYFDAINQLHQQLTPTMPVVEMIEHIAQAVRFALDVPAVVVYREDRENRFLESGIADDAGTQNRLFEWPNVETVDLRSPAGQDSDFYHYRQLKRLLYGIPQYIHTFYCRRPFFCPRSALFYRRVHDFDSLDSAQCRYLCVFSDVQQALGVRQYI
jgi:hypothetical protein